MTFPTYVERMNEYLRGREVGQKLARIAFDARPLQPQTRHWGVGVVVDNVLQRLNGCMEFTGIAHPFCGAKQLGLRTWPAVPKMNTVFFELSAWYAQDADVYWGTNHFVPQSVRTPSVLTVHDMLLLKYPDEQPLGRLLARRLVSSAKRATRILADSRTTADDLIAAIPEVSRKTEVALLGYDCSASGDTELFLYDGERPFVLLLGVHRPRKNLALAVAALDVLNSGSHRIDLVVTGDVHPDLESQIASRPYIRRLGVIARETMAAYLKRASALLFPSRYEGFGLPILEAMAAGCPVLILDTPINRETAGKAAVVLEENAAAWAAAIRNVLESASMRQQLREAGFANLARFSWDSTASTYCDTFLSVQ